MAWPTTVTLTRNLYFMEEYRSISQQFEWGPNAYLNKRNVKTLDCCPLKKIASPGEVLVLDTTDTRNYYHSYGISGGGTDRRAYRTSDGTQVLLSRKQARIG